MPFGLMGAVTLTWPTPFAVPLTMLLSFIMGLQNAVASKTSGGSIRTTHMTGNITDVGIELGKMLYWNRRAGTALAPVRHDRARLRRSGGLVCMFVLGGAVGALGFKYVGFICVVPFAALLPALSFPPLLRDVPRSKSLARRLRWNGRAAARCAGLEAPGLIPRAVRKCQARLKNIAQTARWWRARRRDVSTVHVVPSEQSPVP